MASRSSRHIRILLLLQLAVVCLVVVLGILGFSAANQNLPFATTKTAALGLALAAIVAVTWMTYRATRQVLAPLDWLLREVNQWDPQRPDTGALSPDRIPDEVQGDARQLAGALHGLGERAEAFVHRERDFTRDASHELRTPLTVIRVATDLISADAGLSDRSRHLLARLQNASASMESLMDALLLLARDRDVALDSEDFQVREIVEAEVAKVMPLLKDKGVELDLQIDADPQLHAPPRVLGVMLGSLLSNAVRFTDSGRIRVHLQHDRIDVTDSGIGMDTAALARAFDPFYRANPNQHGSGLGLSIAHRLGQRCSWPLQLVSTPGEGTHATILLRPCVQQ